MESGCDPGRLRQISWLIFLALTPIAPLTAQTQSEADKPSSHIEILNLKWEKQVRLPRNFDPSVIPTNGVFSTMESRTAMPGSTQAPFGDEARQEAARQRAVLAPVDTFPNTPSRMPVFYVYSIRIRNAGPKSIRALAWDYVFINASDKSITASHQLLSYSAVKPHQFATIRSSQRTRPMPVVQAGNAGGKAQRSRLLEQVVIQCVLYADETTWKNPTTRYDACDLLKKNKPAL